MKSILGKILIRIFGYLSDLNISLWQSYGEISDVRVQIGSKTYGYDSKTFLLFKQEDRVEVGSYCSIGAEVRILASGEHFHNRVTSYPMKQRLKGSIEEIDTKSRGPVKIGNDVWIGHGAIIMSGVVVGDGAVVASGALVNKPVPPYSIVAGVPAKVINYRFNQKQIDALLKIQWWNWSEELILKEIDSFYTDIDAFIEKFGV